MTALEKLSQLQTVTKITGLHHKIFLENLVKILRIFTLRNSSGRLLLRYFLYPLQESYEINTYYSGFQSKQAIVLCKPPIISDVEEQHNLCLFKFC